MRRYVKDLWWQSTIYSGLRRQSIVPLAEQKRMAGLPTGLQQPLRHGLKKRENPCFH